MDLGRRTTFGDQDFDLGVVKARIGYVCQEGYYPGQEHVNQDACCVVPNFEGRGDEIFLGVFDGHGENSEVRTPFPHFPPPSPHQPGTLGPGGSGILMSHLCSFMFAGRGRSGRGRGKGLSGAGRERWWNAAAAAN